MAKNGLKSWFLRFSKKNKKKFKKVVDIWVVILYNKPCRRTEEIKTKRKQSSFERVIRKKNLLNNGVWLSLARALDLGSRGRRFESCHPDFCGCSSMVEHQPSKLDTWVRFPSPACIMKRLYNKNEKK